MKSMFLHLSIALIFIHCTETPQDILSNENSSSDTVENSLSYHYSEISAVSTESSSLPTEALSSEEVSSSSFETTSNTYSERELSSNEQIIESSSHKPFNPIDGLRIEAESGEALSPTIDMAGVGATGSFIRVFKTGDVIKYPSINFGTATQSLVLYAAQAYDDARVEFRIDSPNGTLVADILMNQTDSWTNFKQQHISIKPLSGIHDLYMIANHTSGAGDIDWIQFTNYPLDQPIAPELTAISADDSTITLSWLAFDTLASHYRLYAGTSDTKPSDPLFTFTDTTSIFTINNLISGTDYTLWLEAHTTFTHSDATASSMSTTGEAPPNRCLNIPHCADASKGEWTLVVIPDTQHYSQNRASAPISHMIEAFDWLIAMKDQLNIKFVQGLGDITETWNNRGEWNATSEAWNKLYGEIPFIVNQGNHDDPGMLNEYYPISSFSHEEWWGGDYNGTLNTYQLFTFYGEKYLFINIQSYDQFLNVTDKGPLHWANDIISQHPNRKVIIATHDTTERDWVVTNVIEQHDNIVLTNAGHSCGREANWTTTGPGGAVSYNYMTDYQCDANEVMLLRYYIFKPLEDKVDFYTYSPIADSYEDDENSQGSFPLIQIDP
ncbi:MAG: carbohydrate-binding protein [Fibrobacterales bacterium]